MNAPFKSEALAPILADLCIGITGLKRNPAAVIAAAQDQAVAILNHNKPVAYLISPAVWDYLLELADDADLAELARRRLAESDEEIEVKLDDL